MIWRPVLNKHATLEEVTRSWSAPDLFIYACVVEIEGQAQKYRDEITRPTTPGA